jgi:hypothetical protein
MDDSHFDTLVRSLVAARSRRTFSRLLGGLGLGGLLTSFGSDATWAATLIGGSSCRQDTQCKTGTCLSTNTCSCSRAFPKCKQPSNPCKRAVCNLATKRCVTKNAPAGSGCGGGKVCCAGRCRACCEPADCPVPACQTCSGEGTCEPANQGQECEGAGFGYRCCNGACPHPDCVPSGFHDKCSAVDCSTLNCCTGGPGSAYCSGFPFNCFCPPSDTGGVCGNDIDCSGFVNVCICGTCQAPP